MVVAGAIAHTTNEDPKNLNRNMRWTLDGDFLAAKDPSPVMIPENRVSKLSAIVAANDYFTSQKVWVLEVMKKEHRLVAGAPCAKLAVVRKLRQAIAADFPNLVAPTTTDPLLDDVFRPKFYQITEKGWALTMAPDMGLSDCRLHMEGKETIFCIPLSNTTGDNLAEKEKALGAMPIQQFLEVVNSSGFSYQVEAPCLTVVPGHFAVITIGNQSSKVHGMHWSIPGGPVSQSRALEFLDMMQPHSGSVGAHLRGYLQELIEKAGKE